jgi:hypothetical protein
MALPILFPKEGCLNRAETRLQVEEGIASFQKRPRERDEDLVKVRHERGVTASWLSRMRTWGRGVVQAVRIDTGCSHTVVVRISFVAACS